MARFGNFDQYLDNAGDPLAEGKLYFYESGTTTPKTTYADVNNSIPNTNPVLLTAAGRQPNIFFDGVAKVILTDKNDVQIAVRDPVGETATDFGDEWVASKIYSANDVVLGSDGIYYRSLSNGNQNNNPVTSTGYWTLLYSVEWNSGITYSVGDVVTYNTQQYQSLQNSNINQNPASATSYWVSLAFAWLSTATYSEDQNVVGTDGILYTSLQNSNTGNDPATSPAYWVGTSAAAAASATAAAASATAASASETAAAASETAAAASETAAAASESAAASSASAASTSATNAASSASAASTSETNAAASETAAAASASAASTSETNAAASASAASTSETNAAASETAAAASETAAAASESAAATSETNAANSASAASTSASNASTSETNAASSATAAAGSASAASASATAAAGSATDASDKYDEFDARYLGEKASDPSVDNQGGALVEGALYFNTTSDAMKVYDGAAWVNVAPVATSVTVSQISDYTGDATTLNYTSSLSSDAQTQLDAKAVYPTQTGNAGKYLTTDGSSTSWGEVSAAPTISATASGSIANGDPVVINADGTVSAVAGTAFSEGTEDDIDTTYGYDNVILYDTAANAYICVWSDASNLYAKAGTISGTTITWGTRVTVKSSVGNNEFTAVYDSASSKTVILYRWAGTGYIYGNSASISGTTITLGGESSALYTSGNSALRAAYDSNSSKTVLTFRTSIAYRSSKVITLSGSTITGGSEVVISSTSTDSNYYTTTFDSSTNKILAAWIDVTNSYNAYAAVGTVSGTSISWSTPAKLTGRWFSASAAFDAGQNKTVFVCRQSGLGTQAFAATISGTSFTTSSSVQVSTMESTRIACVYDANIENVIVTFSTTTLLEYAQLDTSSGTPSPYGSTTVNAEFDYGIHMWMAFDEDTNKVVTVAGDGNNSNYVSYVVLSPLDTNLSSSNFVGFSDAAYSDAATATVQVLGGVDDAQSSLTTSYAYYVNPVGGISTSPASPEAYAGIALSSTSILIKGQL